MSTVFNQVAVDYDTYRPPYPPAVYDTIEAYAGALADRRVLDVAAGTGIGTRGLVARRARIVAVDLGVDMLSLLRNRSPEVSVAVSTGETLPFADGVFDVVACASAWHWLPAGRRAAEAMRILRPGGVIAVWWGFGGISEEDPRCEAERALYTKWDVGRRELITPEPDFTDPAEDLVASGFADVTAHDLAETRDVSIDDHIGHVSTHSPVLALRDDLPAFQEDLRTLHSDRDVVTEWLSCRVFLARRP